MLTAQMLTEFWKDCFGGAPLAHLLRTSVPDRWVRFYALPGGKRYPENEQEYGIILGRHHALLSTLFSEGSEIVLVTTGWSLAAKPSQEPRVAHSAAWYWQTVRMDPNDPESSYGHLFARPIVWHKGVLDVLLRLAADWQIADAMVLGIAERVAYHPYDGGADVIARDRQQRNLLHSQYLDWASPRADGR